MVVYEIILEYHEGESESRNRRVMETFSLDIVLPILHRAVLACLANATEDGHNTPTSAELFHSPAIHALEEEIIRTGKKLWARQYVDGNGGNISARISPRWVICTPTMCSKADIKAEDISLVDLESRQICGEAVEIDRAQHVFKRAGILGTPSPREIDQLVNSLALRVMNFFKEAHQEG